MINFRLLVLRTDDQKRLADFYSQFGLTFDYHQHGNSPFHYTAEIDQMVLEIYPLEKNQTKPEFPLSFMILNMKSQFKSRITAIIS